MKLTLQLLIGLAVLSSLISCQSSSPETLTKLRETQFPSFEEIYTHVNKQITFPGKDCQFGLAKKADGYYLTIVEYKNNKQQPIQLIKAWDAETQKHLSIDIDKYLDFDNAVREYREGLSQIWTQGKFYDATYAYGYPNYTHDLIQLLEGDTDLSTKELEMLARSYSAEACDYIHPNQTGIEVLESKDLPCPMYEKLDQKRVDSFLKLAEKSMLCYSKIQKTDPSYKTVVFNDLNLKINHDFMNYYLILNSIKEFEKAKSMLERVHYDQNAITYAKELLATCPENGILITSGDSDTFPLWYIQEKLGYKKDVAVINHSLLQAAWYFDMIKQTTNLKSSLETGTYEFYSRTYILSDEQLSVSLDYSGWLNKLKMSKDPVLKDPKEIIPWDETPKTSNEFTLSIQNEMTKVTMPKTYLMGVDLCILDLIHSNPNRTVQLTSPYPLGNLSLKSNLAKRDLNYELMPHEVNGYWDKLSMITLSKTIRENQFNYTTNNTDLEQFILSYQLSDWINLPEEDMLANQELFDLFAKKIKVEERTKRIDLKITEGYVAALAQMNQRKVKPFLDAYASKALQIISSVDNQKTASEKEVEELYSLFNMYVVKIDSYKLSELSVSHQKVISLLKQKVNTLCANPRNVENLSWSWRKLIDMKEHMPVY